MTIRFWRARGGYQNLMALCCPPGHGCNAPGGGEPCALALCREAAQDEEDAALALARWDAFEAVAEQDSGDGKRRFRRRAFERARDKALIGLAMTRDRHRRRPLAA
jgi:hypothetical protein